MKYIIYIVLTLSSALVSAKDFDQKNTLTRAAELIEHQFFDAEIGEHVSGHMKTETFSGQFSNINDKRDFAEAVSVALRNLSGDNHIGIVYSPDDVKRYQLRSQAKTDSDAKRVSEQNYARRLTGSKLANFGIQQLRVLEGNIGYLEMSYFDGFVDESAPVFQAAMDFLASAKVIILDLRRNGGGNSRVLPLFLGYFLGPEPVHFANKIERWKDKTTKLHTDANAEGSRHFDKPIYILTSGTTFSLAEHVTYHLKAFGRAIVVGERTYGGGKAFDPVVIDDDVYLRLPRIEMLNTLTNAMYEEGEGVTPDIATSASEAFDVAYLEALKLLQNTKDEELKGYYRWVERVVIAKANPTTSTNKLPRLTEQLHFGEFSFEVREHDLWMSFRKLPWVKLVNLGNGYFYDDRSIQRQFKITDVGGTFELHVLRPFHKTRVISETT